jgi:hypothetical protein
MPLDRLARKAISLAVFWLILLLLAGCGSAGSAGGSGEASSSDGGADPVKPGPRPSGGAGNDCAPGTYVSSPPTETSPRACAACPSGHFSTTNNAPSCQAWTSCPVDTYVSRAGSATLDQTCTPCAAGTTSTSPNQTSCVPKDSCPAGTTHRAGGGPTDCDECPPGTYCPGAGLPKEACAGGTWDHDNNAATACAKATDCLEGERVFAEPTALSDRSCIACSSGSFSASKNAAQCTDWMIASLGNS